METRMPGKDPEPQQSRDTVQKTVNVLVIEHDPVFLQLLCRFLEKDGCLYSVADSWEIIAEKIRSLSPDVIILGQVPTSLDLQCQVDNIRRKCELPDIKLLVIEQKEEPSPVGAILLTLPLAWRELGNILDEIKNDVLRKVVLLINPDALFSSVLARQFSRLGWRAETAPHVQSANNFLQTQPADMIFMETQYGVKGIVDVANLAGEVPLFLLATRKLKPAEEAQLKDRNPVIFKQGHFNLRELRNALESLESQSS